MKARYGRSMAVGLGLLLSAGACGTRVVPASAPAGRQTVPAAAAGAPDSGGTPAGSATEATAAPLTSGAPAGGTAPRPAAGPTALPADGATTSPLPATNAPGPGRSTSAAAGPSRAPAAPGAPDRPGTPTLPAPVPAGPAPAAAPITIGTLGTFSGPVGAVEQSAAQGVAVWVRSVNARGGVNGHQIKQVVADDAADPARHKALEREMVERRGVQAFVYKVEAFSGQTGPDPYLAQRRIPVVGTFLAYDWDYDSPLYFPQASSGAEFNVASYLGPASELLVPKGLTKLGTMVCVESSVCGQADEMWAKRAKEFGLDDVYRGKVSLGQPDFTAECLAARNAGVQVMFFGFDDKSASRVATSCERQGFHPQYVHTFQAASPALLENPALDGMLIGTLTFPWLATDTPAQREFHADFKAYAPGTDPLGSHASGWVAGKLFETAEKALPATFSVDDLLEGLWSIRNNDLGGLTVPLSFFPDRGAQRHTCWSIVQVSHGKFILPHGTRLTCRDKSPG
ncbi:MAG TPA: ABC transporter substrate-binding protein [Acidimicrobiia bacterium]|nr:ABC transporter substrate-binding protein [Acidimicrobiia bacterium]